MGMTADRAEKLCDLGLATLSGRLLHLYLYRARKCHHAADRERPEYCKRRELAVPIDAPLRRELQRQLDLLERQQRRMFADVGAPLHRWPFASRPVDEPVLADHLSIVAACAR